MVKKAKTDQKEPGEAPAGMKTEAGATAGEQTTPSSGAERDADRPAGEEDWMSKLQEAERQVAENYDKYVRAVAELDNYRKRAIREKADAIRYGNETLLRDILPLVDNMDRALEHACNSDDFEAFRKGLRMLQEQLLGCLQRHGVEPIETAGKAFDPNVHEAMMEVASEGHQDSTVVGEFERGYLLNGRLLRPAKVSVCKRTKGGDGPDCRES
jgi:molecular chaperone GrpE